jgi:acyl-coenzyme A synthetase/AMP-(fatty) acid ligase
VANLLVDELDAGPGDRVAAVLVDCWQTAVVLAACWRVGAGVVAVDPGAGGAALAAVVGGGGVAAAFVGEEWTAEAAAFLAAAPGRPALVALTADLAGRSEHDLGAPRNFARVVPATGDRFAGAADPGGEALRWMPGAAGSRGRAGQAATMAGLLGEAARLASLTGLRDGDRLLSGSGLLTPVGVATGLLAPFGSGAGVVLASAFEPARFWKRVADERVTVAALSPRLGRVGAGGRRRAGDGRRPLPPPSVPS